MKITIIPKEAEDKSTVFPRLVEGELSGTIYLQIDVGTFLVLVPGAACSLLKVGMAAHPHSYRPFYGTVTLDGGAS